ncbi:MAG TPA: nucleotide exchange factor GrpE [Patescibacteria group bacterium]|nr:nucleotide exchange factor GrpE [Patescibacteria group bacterium]
MFKKQDEDQKIEEVQTDKSAAINEELEKKCQEYLAGWQRAQADYINLQKTTERDKAEWLKFANQGLLMEILPIYDHLKLAVKHIPEAQRKESWVVGVENIKNQFGKFLSEAGVEEINTVGEKFNPEEHEAVAADNAESDEHRGVIKEELRGGYKLNGKVLYPAKVIVE